ncbi:Oidioi.mRNA.OKI2018_I69.chr2.g6275.t1.cds [Oikopleura dioica]|uniref:Oidioi.mRNA.OKI2018_I69.chr2.g6275.t1.cds n=1 Tax=Oikopleura dioica TaxID=34765 RepID=A0ABN7T7A6_OIKDI|nr:Oidioi.mRNA.OKI2018_I69.chr2.g6275.t1.cds [Oikopleura dioica]
MERPGVTFRTPQVPKVRRSKSNENSKRKSFDSTMSTSLSSSFERSRDSDASFNSTSTSASRESLDIEGLTREFSDMMNSSFDKNTVSKRKQNEIRFNTMVTSNAEMSARMNRILNKPNQDPKAVLNVFQQLLDDNI